MSVIPSCNNVAPVTNWSKRAFRVLLLERVIPKSLPAFAPLGPLPGFYPGPAGDLKRSPDPSPTHSP